LIPPNKTSGDVFERLKDEIFISKFRNLAELHEDYTIARIILK
jgi:hypothetical protein